MITGVNGCFSKSFCGSIYTLKFTGNAASNFGPLHMLSVFVLCTYQKGFCLQKSVYIYVIGIFVASVILRCLSDDNLSDRGYGLPRGP